MAILKKGSYGGLFRGSFCVWEGGENLTFGIKYTPYVVSENIPFSTSLILLISVFFAKIVPLLKAIVSELC